MTQAARPPVGRLDQGPQQAFARRRKRVSNAMAGFLDAADFITLDIDPGLRPENLAPEDYLRCAEFITGQPEPT